MFEKSKLGVWTKAHNHQLNLALIYIFGLFSFSLLLLFVHRIAQSDDYAFQTQIQPYHTLFDWITYRYNSWSGRVFAESFVYIFSPIPLYFWKLASILFYAVFTGIIFMYYLLVAKKRSHSKDYIMMGLALLLPLMMSTPIISDGILWVTGSMNYFWLSVLGLVGFYPVVYYIIKKQAPHWLITISALPSAFMATSSHEQIGAVITVLSIIFTGYAFWMQNKKKLFPLYLFFFSLFFIIAFSIGILAPGNHVRLVSETATWLPNFYTIPLIHHLEYAYRWFIDALINQFGLMLLLFWTVILTLFVAKRQAFRLDKFDYVVISILGAALLFTCLKSFSVVSYWFVFYPTWNVHAPHASFLILIPWTIILITSLMAPAVLYRKDKFGLLISTLLCAVFASTALITLSPTMYASGFRVLYIPSIVLLLVIYILLDHVYDRYRTLSYLILAIVSVIGFSQYILLLSKYF